MGTTTKQIALLRGINVGKAKRIAMADLRDLLARLGFGDVKTLLNSGNIVYSAPKVAPEKAAARIQQAIEKELGVFSRITVITAPELATALDENPLKEVATDPSRLLFSVLRDPADRARIEPLTKQEWGAERIVLGARVVYLWCPDNVLESRSAKALDKLLGDAVTARNWATMLKLRALAEG